jgi:hypothetical protein
MERFKGVIAQYRSSKIYRALLPDRKEIRILTLHPGSGNDPISLTLEHISLNDGPRYNALSYTWGETLVTRKVLIDGKALPVTDNLHIALKHFSSPDKVFSFGLMPSASISVTYAREVSKSN